MIDPGGLSHLAARDTKRARHGRAPSHPPHCVHTKNESKTPREPTFARGTSSTAELPAFNRSIEVRPLGAPPFDSRRTNRFNEWPTSGRRTRAPCCLKTRAKESGRSAERRSVRSPRAARHGCPSCPRTHLARRPDCRSGEEGSIPFAGAHAFSHPISLSCRILQALVYETDCAWFDSKQGGQ